MAGRLSEYPPDEIKDCKDKAVSYELSIIGYITEKARLVDCIKN